MYIYVESGGRERETYMSIADICPYYLCSLRSFGQYEAILKTSVNLRKSRCANPQQRYFHWLVVWNIFPIYWE